MSGEIHLDIEGCRDANAVLIESRSISQATSERYIDRLHKIQIDSKPLMEVPFREGKVLAVDKSSVQSLSDI